MKKIHSEQIWLIIALCSIILNVTMILFSFYFSLNFVANNFAPDGILESNTVFFN